MILLVPESKVKKTKICTGIPRGILLYILWQHVLHPTSNVNFRCKYLTPDFPPFPTPLIAVM